MASSRTDNDRQHKSLSRRQFNTTVAAASIGLLGVEAEAQTSDQAKIKLGMIGCGGRGTWIAKLFQQHGGYEIVAGADYFADRVNEFGDALQLSSERRYTGLAGYKRLLEEAGVDAVAIESPPYFHPRQAQDAVDAGKHVYLAKPIAVDVPGCMTIEQCGMHASEKGLCFLVDFQTRADPLYIEAVKRVHAGALGKMAFGEATYHAGIPWKGQIQAAAATRDPENRLRSWGLDRTLSGDIITEQNIHALDVASWIMGEVPESAYGTGGQKVREFGTCWDTFSIVFHYPNGVGITFSSRQFDGYSTEPEGIRNRMFGSDGVLETAYGGQVLIRGKQAYDGGSSPGIFKQGAITNIAAFHTSIQQGEHSNRTVAESVRSNLLTILGRTAAYQGRAISWQELLEIDQPLIADLNGLRT